MNLFAVSRIRAIHLICFVGIALVVVYAVQDIPIISYLFLLGDGDNKMRMLEVRDWLSGQSWFDVRQYRVLPPTGIPMHWSRYLDAGIASVLIAAKQVLPATQAEYATLIIWPNLLACVMVLILALGTNRLFGVAGAIGALAVFFGWSRLGGEFAAPQIDHHNVQMLGAMALFYLSLVPGRARLLGSLGGLLTAFTLAIGLEMLPVFATVWGIVALRNAFGEEELGKWLLGFGVTYLLAAPLFMIGQTPYATWGIWYCDVLSVPVLALGAVGVASTLTPVVFSRFLAGPVSRIAAMVIVAGLGLWLFFPFLGHCLSGPYSDVPPEIRKIIATNISEALSAPDMLVTFPAILGRLLLPPMVTLIFALVAFWFVREELSSRHRTALIQAFVVGGIGLSFALMQVRATNLMTPAFPLLGGFVVYAFSRIPRSNLIRLPVGLLLILGMPATVEEILTVVVEPSAGSASASGNAEPIKPRQSCHSREAMAEVAGLPQSLLFNPVNLGTTILVSTTQSVTSASYHRSPDAIWNGIGAFQSVDALRTALKKTGADRVVICEGGLEDGEEVLTHSLKTDKLPVWLKREPGNRTYIAVFKVDKPALSADSTPP